MKTLNEIKNNMQFGDIFTTEYFAEMVKEPCDGEGYYHNGEYETDERVDFSYDLLLKKTSIYPYVCWYNK